MGGTRICMGMGATKLLGCYLFQTIHEHPSALKCGKTDIGITCI